jgi:hypothetical protein
MRCCVDDGGCLQLSDGQGVSQEERTRCPWPPGGRRVLAASDSDDPLAGDVEGIDQAVAASSDRADAPGKSRHNFESGQAAKDPTAGSGAVGSGKIMNVESFKLNTSQTTKFGKIIKY